MTSSHRPLLLIAAAGLAASALGIFVLGDTPAGVGELVSEKALSKSVPVSRAEHVLRTYVHDRAPRDHMDWRVETTDDLAFPGLRGIVLDEASGDPIEAALVYALPVPETPEPEPRKREAPGRYKARVLVEGRTDAEGRFRLDTPRRTQSYALDIGIVANGYLRQLRADVQIPPEGARIRVELARGLGIAGIVTTETGLPIPGLELRASRRRFGTFLTTALLDTENEHYADRASDFHECSAVTDRRGAFSISGLAPGEYWMVADSHEWILTPAARVRAGTTTVSLTAARARALTVRLAAPGSSVPVDGFRVIATVRCGEASRSFAGGGRGGVATLAWIGGPQPAEGAADPDQDCLVYVRIRTPGFADRHERFLWNPVEQPHKVLEVELDELPAGVLRLMTSHDDGSELNGELLVEYAASQSRVTGRSIARKVAPFTHECRLPEGKWFIRVSESSPFRGLFVWRGEAHMGGGTTYVRGVTLPRGAEVGISVPRGFEGSALRIVGKSYALQLGRIDHDLRFRSFPAGEWKLDWLRGGTSMHQQTIRIHAGGKFQF
ncbi:MAG: carboxypeptidase-like regulatory domain-containing protein [Planctomycetota bacterium]